jgi:tetratricopeptide (TPR) repeat protein
MPIFSNQQIPPPANWQDFEALCCDLWRAIWKDPNTQRNGRQGQPQHGVDISGRPNEGHLWAGVQCKGKDNYTNKLLTEDEVLDEVKKSKKFTPKLSEFIIATTGPKDSKIEELARQITKEHFRDALFSVHVWGWNDIVARIEDFPDILEKYYLGLSLNTTALKAGIDNIKESTKAILQSSTEVKSSISSLTQAFQSSEKYNYATISTEILTHEYQAEIDHARDLLTTHKPKAALEVLQKLKSRIWSNATPIVRFRLLTNIGAGELSLNEQQEAAKLFLEALQYNPEDEKALCNAALSYMLVGQLDEAKRYAFKVLEKNPSNSYAHSIVVQVSSEYENLQDIVNKIPEPYRNMSDVAYAIAHIARKKGLLIEAIKWFKTGVDNDKENNPDLEGALGSTILELLTEDRSLLYTNQLDNSIKEKINDAVQLLSGAWEQVANTDLRNLRLNWLVNLSRKECWESWMKPLRISK